MNFEKIQFPLEGNIHSQVHFSDRQHGYAFSFASPYMYEQPADLKQKKAFLLGAYNPFNQDAQVPETIYAYYLVPEKKLHHPNKKLNANLQTVPLLDGENNPIGSLDILSPHSRFLKFEGKIPNIIRNAEGKPVGFCHYQPELRRKTVYSFQAAFDQLEKKYTPEDLRPFENDSIIRLHFTYEVVRKESSAKQKLESLFSAEKKADLVKNRINMLQKPQNDQQALLFITALVAYFWVTLIDLPLAEN